MFFSAVRALDKKHFWRNIMKKAILATKVGMTQIFDADGTLIPVTVLQAGPCVVTQVKTVENDGYSAIQVGYEDIREKRCLDIWALRRRQSRILKL